MDNFFQKSIDEYDGQRRYEGTIEVNPNWNVSRITGRFLHFLGFVLRARNILEIGTSTGYSTLYFADLARRNGGKVYTVESHRERFEMAKSNFENAGAAPFIEQVFGHAPECVDTIPFAGEFDLVFLDATKLEYESYERAFFPRLRKGGILIADNIMSHREVLGQFAEKMYMREDVHASLLTMEAGLLLYTKL